MKKDLQIVVSGYYGCGNAGDEAVLAGIRDSFRQRAGSRVRLVALSQNPTDTEQRHGLRSVYRMSPSVVRQAIRESDLLLSGGGSLLQDTTSVRSLLYYLWVARVAFSLGKPVMFYAQGIGPLRRTFSRTLVRMVANRAAAITVRDEPSARLLASLGVHRPPITVTADPAFALDPAPCAAVEALFAAERIPMDEPMIGVALRPWGGGGKSPVEAYAGLLVALAKHSGLRVALLPMQVPGDVTFAEEVAERTGCADAFPVVRHAYPPDALLGAVARLQAVVAMRLHALIFAARAGVPPFALSYDPKVEYLMRGLGLSDSLEHWCDFDPEEVAERVTGLLSERERRAAALNGRRVERERQALLNADIALQLLSH